MYAPTIRNDDFFKINFKHIPTKEMAWFEGWVTTFSDNFSSQWNEVPVYGRMDPLSTFTRTSRKIQLAFDVPSDNAEMAQYNLLQVNKLITFLYPVYDKLDGTGAQRASHTLKAAPLIELKWTNLIADPGDNSGLIGYLDGINYAPKITDGGFGSGGGGDYAAGAHMPDQSTPDGTSTWLQQQRADDVSAFRANLENLPLVSLPPNSAGVQADPELGSVRAGNIYIPKTLSISLSFTVLHKHLPGWFVSQSETDSYIFGNQAVNGGFPNTQVNHRAVAQDLITTVTTTNEAGEAEVLEVHQITSAFGTEIFQRSSGDSYGYED